LKEAGKCFGGDAFAGVGDGDDDARGTGFRAWEAASFDDDFGTDRDGAASLRGLGGVGEQVDEDLTQLCGVSGECSAGCELSMEGELGVAHLDVE